MNNYDDEIPRHRGKKKNTRKWCKGKVGREHESAPHYRYKKTSIELVCDKCGKQLAWWWPWWKWEEAPDWVPKDMRDEVRASWEKKYK